jgi:hypothetical protein
MTRLTVDFCWLGLKPAVVAQQLFIFLLLSLNLFEFVVILNQFGRDLP